MSEFSCYCIKRDGRMVLSDKDGFDREWATVGEGEQRILEIREESVKRTDRQNKFWHAVVIPAFAEHCGYRNDEMKEALSLALIPKTVRSLDGTEMTVPGHTSELSVKQFNELIERAQQLGAEMDIYIPDPDPAWRLNRGAAA